MHGGVSVVVTGLNTKMNPSESLQVTNQFHVGEINPEGNAVLLCKLNVSDHISETAVC